MTDKKRQEIALFRYGLILPIINNDFNDATKEDYYRRISSEVKKDYAGNETYIAPGTLKSWYLDYKKDGFDGLVPKARYDRGFSRKLNEEMEARIIELKRTFPRIPSTLILDKLVEDGYLEKDDISVRTLQRYITKLNLIDTNSNIKQRLKYEMEYANDCWQADTTYLPHINVNGESKRTYLMMIIDDASRLIVGAKIYFEDNTANFFDVTKSAIKRFGIPKKMFVDNGKNYKNLQVELLFARLGSSLTHAAPYSGASKGKIERVNRTVKDLWLSQIEYKRFNIDQLNEKLSNFIESYNYEMAHSSLNNRTPFDRYKDDIDRVNRKNIEIIDDLFLMEKDCKVYSDSTIRINNEVYQIPLKYSTEKKLLIKYTTDFKHTYIADNEELIEIRIVDMIGNSKAQRLTISDMGVKY